MAADGMKRIRKAAHRLHHALRQKHGQRRRAEGCTRDA
ncbi:hypothetical protein L810_8516 [Burkholderia sp. AU4i]|nr:hypothetical protein L810_8516 [Burkholderia sp. AU4i]